MGMTICRDAVYGVSIFIQPGRPQGIAPTDGISQQLCIMHYELRIIPMDVFPNNYALCITHYELF